MSMQLLSENLEHYLDLSGPMWARLKEFCHIGSSVQQMSYS